ncbi:MAG: hypothetical protein HY711_02235 [Candidatus Melainabacteria bacterium]|nr:hypothetical protein [Candidatus Melainabacteria bacterium]
MQEFQAYFQSIDDYLKKVCESILNKVDRATYSMLVECLKSEDPEAVDEAISQLVREKRLLAIAPLYLVYVAHPHSWLRARARLALKSLIADEELVRLTHGKNVSGSVEALIQKFGHYKST